MGMASRRLSGGREEEWAASSRRMVDWTGLVKLLLCFRIDRSINRLTDRSTGPDRENADKPGKIEWGVLAEGDLLMNVRVL